MSVSVVHPYQWSTPDSQYFLTFNGESDELNVFESKYSTNNFSYKNVTVPFLSSIKYMQCFDYSPIDKGSVAVGTSSGNVVVSNILFEKKTLLIESTPNDRSCNTVSFSTNGLLAAGYDKVRSSCSLKVYDISRHSKSYTTDIYSAVPGELARSVSFIPDEPNSLICGSYKFLRGFDIRANMSVFSFGTTYLDGITVDPLNTNYFATRNEKGHVRVWDRRRMASGGSSSDFLLSINPFGEKCDFWSFRMSTTRTGEFSLLNPTGDGIKRWQTGNVPELVRSLPIPTSPEQNTTTNTSTTPSNQTNNIKIPPHLFISYISQTKISSKELELNQEQEPQNPIVSFDYLPDLKHSSQIGFICFHENGELSRFKVVESSLAVQFDPYNVFAFSDNNKIVFKKPYNLSHSLLSSQVSSIIDKDDDSTNQNRLESTFAESLALDDMSNEDSEFGDDSFNDGSTSQIHSTVSNMPNSQHAVQYTLERDISVTIRKMVMNGYSMNCEKNVELLETLIPEFSRHDKLISAWQWIGRAKKGRSQLIAGSIDFSFEGVMGIWQGYEWISKRKKKGSYTQRDFDLAVSQILTGLEMGKKKRIFTIIAQPNQSKRNLRQLCLRAAGWNFDESQLEPMLQQFEADGQYEKAAGWAVFHGNVNRAVQSLAKSKLPKHRMMSAAIAGYDGYKRTTMNTPWKDLCRNMATSLDNPYMRAVFGFIADGDWSEVLEEASLPLNERLGIALRFYKDNELNAYLNKLTLSVTRNGDIDGVILTGLTPMALDLFQSYVDKTTDVQTAALAISFAYPLYFEDERPMHWIECYRNLLNSWKLYAKRSMFDIARARASRTTEGRLTGKIVPRQVYLSCHNCKGAIGNEAVSSNDSKPSNFNSGMMGPIVGRVNSNIDNGSNNMFSKTGPVFSLTPQQYSISQLKGNSDPANTNVRCPHCNYPLPRCAVCLLPLGSMPPRMGNTNSLDSFQDMVIGYSQEDDSKNYIKRRRSRDSNDLGSADTLENSQNADNTNSASSRDTVSNNKFDRYFIFCLSCSHGMHACHAKEWFSKHTLCAVPDCDCPCTKYQSS